MSKLDYIPDQTYTEVKGVKGLEDQIFGIHPNIQATIDMAMEAITKKSKSDLINSNNYVEIISYGIWHSCRTDKYPNQNVVKLSSYSYKPDLR